MKAWFRRASALWIGILLSILSTEAYDAPVDTAVPRNILVIPEYDQDSLISTHRAYRTAGAKIQDQLAHEFQFTVYDASARQISLQCKQYCDGLAREQLIKKLRETNSKQEHGQLQHAPIDVLVFYHIMSKDMFTEIGVKRLIRISSTAIDLNTGNTIAYDDGGQQQARYINPAEDLTNWTLSIANRHARDSAVFIGERLQAYRGSRNHEYRTKLVDSNSARHIVYLLAGIALVLAVMLLKVSLNNWRLRRTLAGFKDARKGVNA